MPVIEVSNLSRLYGTKRAVDDLSFSVEEGDILVIVGASGCGKTTTLRCIAGLDTPTTGTIRIDGRLMVGEGTFIPPEQRGIGMVFQSYALWPHKTVFENVAYSHVVKGTSRRETKDAVEKAIALVGLEGMEDRYPNMLSGGQQQRVALARCAVAEPRVLLLDEPLSNLDSKLREQMRDELKQLIKKLKSTAVHITHDQTEAMALADKIICMRDGRVEQIGSGRDLYRQPANKFVADFIGVATFLEGEVTAQTPQGELDVLVGSKVLFRSRRKGDGGKDITLCIRPEDVLMTREAPRGPNVHKGRIVSEIFLGDHVEYLVDIDGVRLKAKSSEDFQESSEVFISVDPARVIAL